MKTETKRKSELNPQQLLTFEISGKSFISGISIVKCPYCGCYENVVLTDNILDNLKKGNETLHNCRLCFRLYKFKTFITK
jgi:hypothetical protein